MTRKLKVPGKRKFYLDFNSAVDGLIQDPTPQYLFTVEITLRRGDVGCNSCDDALNLIREVGSVEIIGCEALGTGDKRRL